MPLSPSLATDALCGLFGIVNPNPFRQLLSFFLWGVSLLLGAGCDVPKRPPLKPEDASSIAGVEFAADTSGVPQLALEPPGAVFEGQWDTWDAYFIKDRQVGYAHIEATSTGTSDASNVQYSMDSRLYVGQGPLRLLQRVSQVSTETKDGQLLSFEGALRVGPANSRFSGTVDDGVLKIETIRGPSRTLRTMPWSSTFRGLVGLEQSLRQTPMKEKGEQRNLKMLLPGRYELATVSLRCVGMASVPLLDGELHELLEINCEIQAENGSSTFSTIWTDLEGGIARTHSPALQLIAYRTDKETATNFVGNDQVLASIPVTGEIDAPREVTRVGYVVQPTAAAIRANVSIDLSPAPGQYVRRFDNGVIQVLVSRQEERAGQGFETIQLPPSDADLAATTYVDFNHQMVRKFLALTIKNDQLTNREAAIELTEQVHHTVGDRLSKDGRAELQGLAKASLVAQYWVANTTELAVFLTALLRGQKIPARVVFGLKYLPGEPSRLVFHPWTIAYVDDGWLHLDPTEGGIAAADRLVLLTTDFETGDDFESLLPLLETMRTMQVEIKGQK